ncbi:acyltransferase family protein [Flexivirga lutea]
MSHSSQIRRLDALDGIRGVLVIFLLAYHFGFGRLAGAWLTLNVFFVLSGFLIVRLLVQERARTGSIRFLAFYARRARRLFPALALLLAVVVIYGLGFAPDQELGLLRWDVIATMGYFMNWRLVAQSNQYFVQFTEPSVLQHTWSLSVEEQFYLVIPVLVLGLMALVHTRRALIAVLVGLALVSAGWMAVVGVGSDVARSHLYYGTDTRAQSLLVGAALGVWTARLGRQSRPSPFTVNQVQLIGGTALAITLAGFILVDPQTTAMADGGMFALSLAAAASVWAAADERIGPLQKCLSVRPLAALGRISYGAYLWHWPIGLWIEQAMPSAAVWQRVLLGFILTVGVAALSYQRLEKPIHDRGWGAVIGGALRARTTATTVALALFVGAVGIGVGAPAADGVPRTNGSVRIVSLVPGQQAFHEPVKPYTIALYGDSVPYLLVKNFPAKSFPGVTAKAVAVPGCDILNQPWLNPKNGEPGPDPPECQPFRKHVRAQIAAAHSDLVIVFPAALLAFKHRIGDKTVWWGDEAYESAVRSRLDAISSAAKANHSKVAIVTGTCRSTIPKAIRSVIGSVQDDQPALLSELKTGNKMNSLIRDWAKSRDIPIADLHHAVCPNGKPRSIKGMPIFGDGIHFSAAFTPSVWAFLIAELGLDT